jgi:hypothetical protein
MYGGKCKRYSTGLKITPFSIKKSYSLFRKPVVTGCAFFFISKAKIVPKLELYLPLDALF